MVTDEEKRADRFQQKLKMNIQVLLIPQQLKTFAQVLTIAREIERGLIRKDKSQVRENMMKKLFLKEVKRRLVVYPTSSPLTKRSYQSPNS